MMIQVTAGRFAEAAKDWFNFLKKKLIFNWMSLLEILHNNLLFIFKQNVKF